MVVFPAWEGRMAGMADKHMDLVGELNLMTRDCTMYRVKRVFGVENASSFERIEERRRRHRAPLNGR